MKKKQFGISLAKINLLIIALSKYERNAFIFYTLLLRLNEESISIRDFMEDTFVRIRKEYKNRDLYEKKKRIRVLNNK